MPCGSPSRHRGVATHGDGRGRTSNGGERNGDRIGGSVESHRRDANRRSGPLRLGTEPPKILQGIASAYRFEAAEPSGHRTQNTTDEPWNVEPEP